MNRPQPPLAGFQRHHVVIAIVAIVVAVALVLNYYPVSYTHLTLPDE